MTSLQRQLAAIAANSTHQLDLKAQKAAHSKSLLFDPKVAVSQDFNTLYQLCYEGFEELRLLDNRFSPFSTSLFSEQSKAEERAQWTADQNKELDTVLEDFLGLVGSRILLKPAQKAVEWLIRRFRVHEYNTERLILTFMPYHSTPVFLSLLSILPRQLPPTFRFLYPYITRLANPPIKAIVHAASNNRPFFAAFNRYVINVSQARQQYPALVSFWASIASQAADGMLSAAQSGREGVQRHNLDEILLVILPVLNDGLALAEMGSVTEACCTVIMVIAAKGILSDKVTGGLMKAIARAWPEATIDVRLICLALLAQERGTRRLPKAVVKALLRLEHCAARLALLSRSYRVDRLALSYALGCVHRMTKTEGTQEAQAVQSILDTEILNDKQRKTLITHLLEHPRRETDTVDSNGQQWRNHARLVLFFSESERHREMLEAALKELNIDVEELKHHLQINTSLAQPRNGDSEEMQIEPSPQDEAPSRKPSHNRFTALSQMEPKPRSFLDAHEWSDFNSLADGFADVFAFPVPGATGDNFLQLPVLRKNSAFADPTYVSFLIRIWSGKYPASSRVAALEGVSTLFSDGVVDPVRIQWAIPYLVVALADESKIVRQSSAKVLNILSSLHTGNNGMLPNGQSREMTWAFDELYPGSTITLESLTADDVRNLVQVSLLPKLEACVLDRNVISKVIQNALTGTASKKADMFTFFACHASATPLLTVQSALIAVLATVNKNSSSARSTLLRPCVETWIGFPAEIARARCAQEKLILSEVDTAMISIVRAKDEDSIQMLRQLLQGPKANARSDIQDAAFRRLKQIWSSIPTDEQQTLAVLLLDIALDRSTDDAATHRKDLSLETLDGVKLSTEALTALLNSLATAIHMPENPPPAKRRRTSRSETSRVEVRNSEELAQTLRRYTITLELVEKSSPEKHPELLKPLFQCLGEMQHYKLETNSGLEYLQGLVIDSLLRIVRNAESSKDAPADKSVIRTDLLVDCIRHTTNPQVQNAALLLVAGLSRWVPEAVLHSVMPIFTFMGSTTLRQSDDYSAHVIHQTVSQVIPPLVVSLRKSSRQILNGVVDLLLSFVAAFEHMPQHRRLGLFKKVMTALGAEDCLFAVLVMLVDRYPMDDRVREFLMELLDQFDASIQLLVFAQYVDLLIDLSKPRRGVSEVVLNLREKSNDEIHTITHNLLEALAGLLENPRIRLRIDASFNGDENRISSQRRIFAKLIQAAIKNSQSFSSQRDLEEKAARVLSDVFQLVPLVELLRSAEPLIQQSIDDVRQVVLAAITEQAEHVKSTDTNAKSALIDFIPNITFVIKSSAKSRLRRTAIACVDQISERFGKQDASKIGEAAPVISGPDALGQSDNAVRIMSLLCLASMVDVLRDNFIPLLPDLFSRTFEYLRLSIADMESHTGLHNACFTLINAIVEHLPFIFTGNILDTSLQLAQASGTYEVDVGVQNSRSQFYQLLTEKLSPAELFPALTRNSVQPEQEANLKSILEYAEFAKAAVEHHSKSAVSKNAATLFDLALRGFDYYRTLATQRPNAELGQAAFDRVESIFLEIAVSLTMKLSDLTFRPLFVRSVEWVNELPNDDRLGRSYRATTLFRFFRVLSGKLKSLITAYSSYVLELAAGLLESTNVTDENADRLLRATLGALGESFEHDQDDFWQSPSHFETISMPLLSRLSKPHGDMLADSVIPTITALATTANSQDHHKAINSQILQLMRSDMRDTRLAAVKCEQALTEKLGEEWLALLPEMLPFITELLEDGDDEVERESRRWIKRVEEILGESLEGMLQ